jgi:TraX protein
MATRVLPRSAIGSSDVQTASPGTTTSRFVIADGTLEVLKWLALVLMVADHVNKYFFKEELPAVFELGRIVMPIFGFILVYNLSRSGAIERGVFKRVMIRLALFGAVSVPICILLNQTVVRQYPWWPLNILFTLLLVTGIVYLIELGGWHRRLLASVSFLLVSPFVEYAWMGVLTCLGAWLFCRQASFKNFFCWFLGVLSLTIINRNAWALAAMPLLLMASRVKFDVPRSKWAFYTLYPVHLLALLAVKL